MASYDKLEPSAEDRAAVTSSPPTGPQPPLYGQPQTYPPPNSYQAQPYPPQQQPYAGGTPAYGGTTAPPPAQYVVAGGCPRCGGFMQEDFSCLGICCAIVFFPIGLLCCFLMKERRCGNCGYSES